MAALVDGRPVVDLWTMDLREDALVCTWSAIKPVTGACLLLLVERGVIGLADPVSSVWAASLRRTRTLPENQAATSSTQSRLSSVARWMRRNLPGSSFCSSSAMVKSTQ